MHSNRVAVCCHSKASKGYVTFGRLSAIEGDKIKKSPANLGGGEGSQGKRKNYRVHNIYQKLYNFNKKFTVGNS
jgi:hypothetical protein